MSIKINMERKFNMSGTKPKIITITNVLAQINDLNEFAYSLHNIASKESLIVIEFPYLLDMINKSLFDLKIALVF